MNASDFRRRKLLLAGTAAALSAPLSLSLPSTALAQSGDKKLIKIIVGFPPGQATDVVARLLAERLGSLTGDTYIVDNRPGQGGSIAMGAAAKAAPDGTTMMLTHMSAVATNPHMYKTVPYNSLTDYEAVGLVGDLPFVLVVNPTLPVKSVKELIAYAKAHPDTLTNASSGNGTVSHLAMEEFKRASGIKIAHIPYKGSSLGLTDVIAGNVSMALESAPAVMPHVQSGKLRALAAGSAVRLAGIPNVPTMAEEGFKNFNAVTWLMLIYPNGTPKPIVNNMFTAMNKVTHTPDFDKRLNDIGALPRDSKSPDEAQAYIKTEFKSWGEVVKRNGVSLD